MKTPLEQGIFTLKRSFDFEAWRRIRGVRDKGPQNPTGDIREVFFYFICNLILITILQSLTEPTDCIVFYGVRIINLALSHQYTLLARGNGWFGLTANLANQ